ncbi:NAD-dependent deacylase [Myxococcota bacterium]|nr:NAD-dependent deacylase [Myxococcota bacterium]
MQPMDFSVYRRIVILTGAGISVASGLRPYRGAGGVWGDIDPQKAATRAILEQDPQKVWELCNEQRRQVLQSSPNPAHLALASLEASLHPTQQFLLVTQNVDGLHHRAGSQRVVALHGDICRTRCTSADCSLAAFVDTAAYTELPRCSRCGSPLRPDIVLFDEPLPVDAEWAVKRALRDCDLFLAVGTSGTVAPASNFVRSADYVGARTIFVNLEPMDPPNPYFHESLLGRAEEILPVLCGVSLSSDPG